MITAVYLGQIGEVLDFELIEKLAQENIVLLFIGPIVDKRFKSLLEYKNIIWLGEQKYEKLGYLLRLADVGIMPFVINARTSHLNPSKVYIYFACQLPVVSTKTVAFQKDLQKYVRFAEDHEHFIQEVKDPMPKIKAYSDFARLNSWDTKTAEFVSLIKAEISNPFPM